MIKLRKFFTLGVFVMAGALLALGGCSKDDAGSGNADAGTKKTRDAGGVDEGGDRKTNG